MNLFELFAKIDELDPESGERLSFYNRRHILKNGAKATALAALPTLFSSVVNKAYGADLPAQTRGVLEYALTLEYLEADYYEKGVKSGIIPQNNYEVFSTISQHETAHVRLLEKTLGIAPDAMKPKFKYDAYPDVFTNYKTFLVVSQSFEDLGVRAYKNEAKNLMESPDLLQVALQIHAVEARHAAVVRSLRGQKGWIVGNGMENGMAPAVPAIYEGELNTEQGGVELAGKIAGQDKNTLSESFDEPLGRDQVLAIAKLFLA